MDFVVDGYTCLARLGPTATREREWLHVESDWMLLEPTPCAFEPTHVVVRWPSERTAVGENVGVLPPSLAPGGEPIIHVLHAFNADLDTASTDAGAIHRSTEVDTLDVPTSCEVPAMTPCTVQ